MTRVSLDVLQVREPCSMQWDALQGAGPRRFCEQCELHVANTAGHTRDELETMLHDAARSGSRLCLRVERDASGRVVTREPCEPGRAGFSRHAARSTREPVRGWRKAWKLAPAAVLSLAACGPHAATASTGSGSTSGPVPVVVEWYHAATAWVVQWFRPAPPPAVMGSIAAPTPVPASSPAMLGRVAPPPPPTPAPAPEVLMGEATAIMGDVALPLEDY